SPLEHAHLRIAEPIEPVRELGAGPLVGTRAIGDDHPAPIDVGSLVVELGGAQARGAWNPHGTPLVRVAEADVEDRWWIVGVEQSRDLVGTDTVSVPLPAAKRQRGVAHHA